MLVNLILLNSSKLTFSRRDKTCTILIWLTPDDFTRQEELPQ